MGALKVLRQAFQAYNFKHIDRFYFQQSINWHFNPLTASHIGGAWERMIRSTRKILQNLLGYQTLNDESCLTLMAEVEAVIKSRPLIPLSFTDSGQNL